MGKPERWLQEIRAGKKKGWRFEQIRAILEVKGFRIRPKAKGSHRIFKHPSGDRIMVLDKGSGELPPVYVERALEAIRRVEEGHA